MGPIFKWAILVTLLADVIVGLAGLRYKRAAIKASKIIEEANIGDYTRCRPY